MGDVARNFSGIFRWVSVGTTTRRVHLPVAWAVCRVDQVTVSSTLITPYILLRLFLSFLFLLLWWFSVFDSIIVKSCVFLLITSGLYRHLNATSAALTAESEPQHRLF